MRCKKNILLLNINEQINATLNELLGYLHLDNKKTYYNAKSKNLSRSS